MAITLEDYDKILKNPNRPRGGEEVGDWELFYEESGLPLPSNRKDQEVEQKEGNALGDMVSINDKC
ncbi:MAG: hypothetical protein ABL959_10075 [Pyrinomonadaceae bacterium]